MLDIQIGGKGPGTARRDPGIARRPSGRPAVAAVTLGIFTVMTAELLPVGLLTPAAADLSVTEGAAALMVTVPG
ncbi:MFS transporter, partial [Streptomyces gardneri]